MLRELLFASFMIVPCTAGLFLYIFPFAAQAAPERADIAKIYNIEREADQKVDVRFFRKKECSPKEWCRISGEGEYLQANDWLQTGQISRADLALTDSGDRYRPILFWQQEGSRSKYDPREGTCHFQIDIGGFLYAHPKERVDDSCKTIASKDALIFPYGTALFIIGRREGTLVGILSNHPTLLTKVQHRKSGKSTRLGAGFYAETLPNGDIREGQFDLEDFYKNHPLSLGLGPDPEDDAYVARQDPAIQRILIAIRTETVSAIAAQNKTRSSDVFDPMNWFGRQGGNQSDPDDTPRGTAPRSPTSPPVTGSVPEYTDRPFVGTERISPQRIPRFVPPEPQPAPR